MYRCRTVALALHILLLTLITCSVPTYAQLLVHNLAAEQWTVTNANGSITAPVQVPGYVLEALEAQRIIPDPLYRYGEQELRWVALDSWTFQTSFELAPDVHAQKHVDLLLSGIDTVADVSLNGRHLASMHNFHRHYRLPLTPHLRPPGQTNHLAIRINSSITFEAAAKSRYPYELPSAAAPYQLGTWAHLRKTASDGGWDWGPSFAPQGIAGLVLLHAYSSPYLAGVHIQQVHSHANSSVTLLLESQIVLPAAAGSGTSGSGSSASGSEASSGASGSGVSGSVTGVLSVSLPELGRSEQWDLQLQLERESTVLYMEVGLQLKHSEVELWWPGELGTPKLYDVHISFTPLEQACNASSTGAQLPALSPSQQSQLQAACNRSLDACHLQPQPGTHPPGQPLPPHCTPPAGGGAPGADPRQCSPPCTTSLVRRVGFREVQLVTEPVPDGESFYFRVNGVAMFLAGANFIPMQIVPTNASLGKMEGLLAALLDAHMNMIRVWGGGFYQRDTFYELCDERGVLVWQEAMFACASYPRTPEFLSDVREEIEFQVRRLAWHPSIAIWGGNNEVENSFEWFQTTRDNPHLYAVDYTLLFVDTIGGAIRKLDPARPWVDTSPSNGMLAPALGVKRWGSWANQPQHGDIHYYNYNDDCQAATTYPGARFVSEFGFQSFPSFPTLQAVTDPTDWAVDAPMSQYRQRHPEGNPQLQAQLGRHFRLPFAWSSGSSQARNASLYRTWIYLTQVQQAACYTAALGRWRAYMSDASACTMGVLYWQLNDIWQGPSWSSINSDGRWKVLHHAVKGVFAPVALHVLRPSSGALEVHVLNNRPVALVGTLEIWAHMWDDSGEQCGFLYRRLVLPSPAMASHLVFALPAEQLLGNFPKELVEAGFNPFTSFLRFTYEHALAYFTRRPPQEVSLLPCFRSMSPDWQQRHAAHLLASATTTTPTSDLSTPPTTSDTSTPATAPPATPPTQPDTPPPEPKLPWQERIHQQHSRWSSDTTISEVGTHYFPQPFSSVALSDPRIGFSDFKQINASHVGFTITSAVPAPWVVMYSDQPGNFDRNGFLLMPCLPRSVVFGAVAGQQVEVQQFRAGLTVESMFDHQGLGR